MSVVLVVNPAAGGGRSGRKVGPWVERLKQAGVDAEVWPTTGPGHATELARQAASEGAGVVVAVVAGAVLSAL